ncbi:MAG TPA: carboxypeptidase-like regulatory domain-containing protein [Gemmatimonadaceae bacterium]|nr:carboxypeptidase-like regulatory domain-containing protein [Gemmatimonadaceae bacterium]
MPGSSRACLALVVLLLLAAPHAASAQQQVIQRKGAAPIDTTKVPPGAVILRKGPAPQDTTKPPSAAELAQRHHDVIRGRVTSADSGTALTDVEVIATRSPDRAFKSAKTDADGRYVLDWPDGTGDYLVHVAAVGFQTFRKRVTRTGTDSVFEVDVKLVRERKAQQLAAVVTTAQKPKPTRGASTDVGASENYASGMNGAVSPDQAGDLAALAGTIPGVTPTGGGISVLGLGPSQNSTTLNGMAFPGADVPRDARTSVRVSSSSYDPSIGWFSGARTDVELAPGNIFSSRRAHVTLDAPALQYTDPVSSALGQRFTNLNGSVGGDGELDDQDKWFYNYGLQGGRRSGDATSVLSADPLLLEHSGASADSVARFLQLLQSAHVPVGAGLPSSAINDNVSFIGRIDHAPYEPGTYRSAKQTWGVTAYAKYQHAQALAMSPVGTPGHAGENSQAIGSLQGEYSFYFGNDYLGDIRSSVAYNRNRSDPYLNLPDGRVLVASTFPDATGGVSTLQFGGNSGLANETRQWTWESTAELQFYPRSKAAHRVKVNADSRLDGVSQDIASNALGSFAYNSLADLQANQPASFTRTLNSPTRSGGAWNGFASIGDLWRVSQALQVMYGARVEGTKFTSAPAYNPAVASAFGYRTDHAPGGLHVSPRLGFTWIRGGQDRQMMMANPIGEFRSGSPGTLRGGIGEFRNLMSPSLLSNASVATGLPNGITRISCIGSAVPTPDWSAWAADPATIPTQCAGGGGVLADAAPGVQLFDPSYDASRSWRANLSWSSVFGPVTYSLEGIYSLNLNQPGTLDLNFSPAPKYTLPGESRPMFVNPSSIVPSTGAVSSVDARRTQAFGRVVDNVSDLRSVSRQFTVTLAPNMARFFTSFYASAAYSLSSIRAQQRGFDGSTFGDPTARDWARGDLDARHQFTLQAGYYKKGVSLTLQGRFQSGTPFTPMIGSDVNGDGLANDRAFIYDPASVSDPAMAAGLRSLLATSTPGVRNCLLAQVGQAAARNSCEGPWTAALNARIGLSGRALHVGERVNVGINLANPLGGLDQLLHGSSNLRGWGTPSTPDPVLFTVAGYDQGANRFKYLVNPRFGSTRPSANTIRAPFRLTLDVSVDIGRGLPEQQLDKWLKPGRAGRPGHRLTAAELKARYERNVPDPYNGILQESDSLLLTREQVESLQQAQAAYRVRMDSLWTALADYMASLPDDYDAAAALKRSEDATDAGWELSRQDLQKTLRAILTPVQLAILPFPAKLLYDAKEPVHIRMFFAGG